MKYVALALALAPLGAHAFGIMVPPTAECEHETSAGWHPDFPPEDLSGVVSGGTGVVSTSVAMWFKENLATIPMLGPPPMTAKEKKLVKLSAGEWFAARKAGEYTCVEYASALTKRAMHYKYMNQFMYWDNLPDQMNKVLAQAAALDALAMVDGVDAIGPLYCLPVPCKGTMASVDYPSSAGVGLLHDTYGLADAGAIKQLKLMGGVVFGKTNVPEFAASYVTCNHANGCTLNPYDHAFTVGGSSGGSASSVASYFAPVAFTEDTGGSTRHPAEQNQNFGYDPTRNHFPNDGNPGITFTQDQVGINARSMADIIAFDAAFLGLEAEHAVAAESTPDIVSIKIGLPQFPFVEFGVPEGGYSALLTPAFPTTKKVSKNVFAKYKATIAALKTAGAVLVEEEWPDSGTGKGVSTLAEVQFFAPVPNFDGGFEACHSFTGQMAEWMRTYLGSSVSVAEVIADSYATGLGHAPAGFMLLSGVTDETKFRYAVGQWQYDTVTAWNSLFDLYDLDFILSPVSYCDTLTYECQADATCTAQFDTGSGYEEVNTSLGDCNIASLFAWKNIPVPKVAFPVGKDANGNVVNMELWGRAGPKGVTDSAWLFDDSYAKTADVEFLHKVKTLTDAIYAADPTLVRVDANLVTMGSANLF